MIAADTSTWISFFGGEQGDDVLALARALQSRQVVMPPPVLTELLSDPELSASVAQTLMELPLVVNQLVLTYPIVPWKLMSLRKV